jgi:RNA polymerase sigma factor (sigma-70 family)
MTAKQKTKNGCACDSETDLLRRIACGDRNAFTCMYLRYLNDLYKYAFLCTKSKDQAEELVQAVFVKIWERREALVNVVNFKSYVFHSVRNLMLDEIRRSQVKKRILSSLMPATDASPEYSDSKIIYAQYYEITEKVVGLLPKKRKQIFELRTRDELSLDEISAKLCISKGVVKKQLYASLAFVRNYFEKNSELMPVWFFLLVVFFQ